LAIRQAHAALAVTFLDEGKGRIRPQPAFGALKSGGIVAFLRSGKNFKKIAPLPA
jgi:hypothetical protein